MKSDTVKRGLERAPHRALLHNDKDQNNILLVHYKIRYHSSYLLSSNLL